MNSLIKIFNPILLTILGLTLFITPTNVIHADYEANLIAESLTLEETDDGISLVLEGPVEIIYGDDTITADSATVHLGADLSSLYNAIETIELAGNVVFRGLDNTSGTAGSAVYFAGGQRLVLSGNTRFNQRGFTASAGSLDYSIGNRIVTLAGGCTLSEETMSARASRVEYNLDEKSGSLSGSVEILYSTGGILFADEEIDLIEFRSDAVFISLDDGIVRTPEGPEARRASIIAGNFTLDADRIELVGSPDSINSVTAEGNVVIDGPNKHVEADSISLVTQSPEIRILNASGNVSFSIYGQEGTADEIVVNLGEGWSIRLVGASIGGTIEGGLINGDSTGSGVEESGEE